jgi:hypothetical protein
MTASTDYMVIPSISATPTKYTLEAAASTIGVLATTGATASPANATVEIWGYLF